MLITNIAVLFWSEIAAPNENVTSSICSNCLYFPYVQNYSKSQYFFSSEKYVPVSIHEGVRIKLKPTLIMTSETLRSYDPNVRGCLFNSESHLRFFKTYTQNNCETECLANYTNKKCGCVKFSMPSTLLPNWKLQSNPIKNTCNYKIVSLNRE